MSDELVNDHLWAGAVAEKNRRINELESALAAAVKRAEEAGRERDEIKGSVMARYDLGLRDRAERRLGEMRESLRALMAESHGVAGLHRNGEVADWEWLIDNGWLPDFASPAQAAPINPCGPEGHGVYGVNCFHEAAKPDVAPSPSDTPAGSDGPWSGDEVANPKPCPHCGGKVGLVNGGEGYWYPRRDCLSCGRDTTKVASPPSDTLRERVEALTLDLEAFSIGTACTETGVCVRDYAGGVAKRLRSLLSPASSESAPDQGRETEHSRGCKRSLCEQGMWCPEQHRRHAAPDQGAGKE